MTDERNKRMAAIQARQDARTPGEWYTQSEDEELAGYGIFAGIRTTRDCDHEDRYRCEHCSIVSNEDGGSVTMRPADANLIAHAPADIDYLLAEVERWAAKCHSLSMYIEARSEE